jgi:hypothetical protein
MTTKLHQDIASSGSADAPTRSLAADVPPSSAIAETEEDVKDKSTLAEADRRPAGPPREFTLVRDGHHLPSIADLENILREMGRQAKQRGIHDCQIGVPVIEGGSAFLRDGACAMELATYARAYVNEWHRSNGHDDLTGEPGLVEIFRHYFAEVVQ